MKRMYALAALGAASPVTSACGLHCPKAVGLHGHSPFERVRVGARDATLHRACEDDAGVARRSVVLQGSQITDLAALACLTQVRGDLVIRSSALTDLDGLDHLVRVDGDLVIRDNPGLASLRGLGGLTHVGGTVRVVSDRLASLDGLALQQAGGLWLTTPRLESVAGLSRLEQVGGALDLGHTHALRSLTGLESLRTVGGDLVVASHASLVDVRPLSRLEAVGGSLVLGSLPRIGDLNGLENLHHTGGLDISLPARFRDLGGLSGLARIDGPVFVAAPGAPAAAARLATRADRDPVAARRIATTY